MALKVRLSPKLNLPAGAGAIVHPAPGEPKSGCFFCPLAPFHKDFETFATKYQRNAEKILAKEKDGHTIHNRNVCERPWKKVRVLFVGEAPGAEEDKKGSPFVGKSGHLLRGHVKAVCNLAEPDWATTNLLRCRPPRNRDPNRTEVRCCGHELVKEILAREPELIVVLGNHSLEFLTGQTGITTLSGHLMKTTRPDLPETTVLACLHPAYILRFDFMHDHWCETLGDIPEFLSGKLQPKPGPGTYVTVDTVEQLRELRDRFLKAKLLTFDTETGALTPFQTKYPPLLCFSFSDKAGEGYVVPFDHPDSPWCDGGPREDERPEVSEILFDIFTSEVPKVGQNEKFDRQHIRKALALEVNNLARDTMLTHFVQDERRGIHGLKRLAYLYTGMGGYERPLEVYIKTHREADPGKGGSYANIPGEILFPYAGMDADVTWRVDEGLQQEDEYTKHPKLQALATHFYPKLSRTLADLEYNGAHVNLVKAAELTKYYKAKMDEFEGKIAALPIVKQFEAAMMAKGKKGDFRFNPGSPSQLSKILFDHYGLTPTEMTDAGFDRLVHRFMAVNASRTQKGKPPVSFSAVVTAAIEKKEWEFFSTKAEVLHEYERKGNELAPLILSFRDHEVVYGTFLEPLAGRIGSDGLLHGTFHPTGTATARLSSSDPNLQNIPEDAKPVYDSRFGDEGALVTADYSQIELRIAASWFNDPKMIRAYKEGIDLHALTAADMHHMTLEQFMALPEEERDPMRKRAKRINFGVLYGGGPPALVSTLKKDGIYITVEEAQGFIEQYFAVRPALKLGIQREQEKARQHGFIEAFTGHRRRVPEVFSADNEIVARALRQCVNMPIQCGAALMTLMALIILDDMVKAEKMRSVPIFTVHDSIVFDSPLDEVVQMAQLTKTVMENLPKLAEEVLPGLDWKWLRGIPIKADVEVGFNWGAGIGFDPDVIAAGDQHSDEPLLKEKNGKQKQGRDPLTAEELLWLMNWKKTA